MKRRVEGRGETSGGGKKSKSWRYKEMDQQWEREKYKKILTAATAVINKIK